MLRLHAAFAVLFIGGSSSTSAADGRRIQLSYDEALIKADFPNPAARLTVGGRSGWFLFDTGAGVHILASWFVKAARLSVDETLAKEVSGRDSTGRALAFRGVRNVTATLADTSHLELPVAAVTDFPPEFEEANVAGVISPQLLAPRGEAAALDLRVPELRLETFDAAVRRVGARVVPREQVMICGSASGPVPNLLFAIQVMRGGRNGRLLIDTGARSTDLARESPLVEGALLEPGGEKSGLAGQRDPFSRARGIRIEFAGHTATVDARVSGGHDRACGRDGLLGLDATAACALVLGSRDLAAACGP